MLGGFAASPSADLPYQAMPGLAGLPPEFADALRAQIVTLQTGLVGDETRPGDPLNYPLPWLRDGAYVVVALARAGRLISRICLAGNLRATIFSAALEQRPMRRDWRCGLSAKSPRCGQHAARPTDLARCAAQGRSDNADAGRDRGCAAALHWAGDASTCRRPHAGPSCLRAPRRAD